MKQLLPAALLWLSASTVLAAPNAQALATSKNCLACHAIDRKLVGPSYQDVAARYAGQKDAVSRLAEKIQKGGAGSWGPVPMPANPVTPEEAKTLATWVLSHKK